MNAMQFLPSANIIGIMLFKSLMLDVFCVHIVPSFQVALHTVESKLRVADLSPYTLIIPERSLLGLKTESLLRGSLH